MAHTYVHRGLCVWCLQRAHLVWQLVQNDHHLQLVGPPPCSPPVQYTPESRLVFPLCVRERERGGRENKLQHLAKLSVDRFVKDGEVTATRKQIRYT